MRPARGAHATKLFAINATYSGGDINVQNHSLPDLIENLVKGQNDFSVLKNEDIIDASITYFAMPQAMDVKLDRTNPQVIRLKLTSTLTGLDKDFEATSEDDLKRQLAEWLYLDGSTAAAELLKAVIRSSAAVITDGSPGSTTAQMTDSTFRMFGLYGGTAGTNGMRGAESGAHFGIWYDGDSYTIDSPAGELEGNRWRVTVPLWLHFNARISLAGLVKVDYNNVEGTEFYGGGADLGLALRPVVRKGMDRFGWQITPYVGAHGIGSVDGVTAAVVSHVGVVNRLEWRVFERSLFALVSQYTTFDNLKISLGDLELTTPIDQDLMKNGLLYEFPFISKRLYANVQFIDTRFLKESRVDNFQTYGLGMTWRLKTFALQGTMGYDKSDQYSGTMWNLGVTWDL